MERITANSSHRDGFATLYLRADPKLTSERMLAAKLNNAIEKRYVTVFGYNEPGREAFLSLRRAQR